jgi:hypothetical protein
MDDKLGRIVDSMQDTKIGRDIQVVSWFTLLMLVVFAIGWMVSKL